MSTRRNGLDLDEQAASEQGLSRRMRANKSKRDEILFYFELMRRIRSAARRISRRDDELIEAVVRHQTLTDAARNLAPENAEALRSYLSQRLRAFKEIARLVLEISTADPADSTIPNELQPPS